MTRAKPEEPLFLWVHYTDPHFPYHPPKSQNTPTGERCKQIMRAITAKNFRLAVVQGNHQGLGEASLEDCTGLYDAEIAYMDWQIGRLLKGLESAGRLENVIIVFTADHGEAFGEAGLFYEHGTTLHDAVLKVPLLITAPGVKGGLDDEAIRLEDLMPTILALADLGSQAPETDGVDQSRRLRGRKGLFGRPIFGRPEPVIALAESGSALLIGASAQPFEGLRTDKNCVHGPRFSLCTLPGAGTRLCDRMEDPKFSVDVSEAHPRELAILRPHASAGRWGRPACARRAAGATSCWRLRAWRAATRGPSTIWRRTRPSA